jgi:hypothetical protein
MKRRFREEPASLHWGHATALGMFIMKLITGKTLEYEILRVFRIHEKLVTLVRMSLVNSDCQIKFRNTMENCEVKIWFRNNISFEYVFEGINKNYLNLPSEIIFNRQYPPSAQYDGLSQCLHVFCYCNTDIRGPNSILQH